MAFSKKHKHVAPKRLLLIASSLVWIHGVAATEQPPPPRAALQTHLSEQGPEVQAADRIELAALPHLSVSTMPPSAFSGQVRLDMAPVELYGSVSLPIARTVHGPRWATLMAEDQGVLRSSVCAGGDQVCSSDLADRLRQVIASLQHAPIQTKISTINDIVNRLITYARDEELYGRRDHWATLRETLASGRGDCEDIALLKYRSLEATGVAGGSMHLVLARDTFREVDHAVLVVRVEDRNYVLDNRYPDVRSDRVQESYMPLLSLSRTGAWLHAVRRQPGT